MRGRDTAEETAQFVAAIVDALNAHRILKVLISIRESRPIFKVEDWHLSAVLDQMKDTPGLKAAFISDSRDVAMSQEYIALLGRQRGFDFQAFASEKEAIDWLT